VGCKRRVVRAAVEEVVVIGDEGFGGGRHHRGANAQQGLVPLVSCSEREVPRRCRTTNKNHIKIKNQPRRLGCAVLGCLPVTRRLRCLASEKGCGNKPFPIQLIVVFATRNTDSE